MGTVREIDFRTAALALWWTPALVLAISDYVLRAAGMEFRLRRVDRLLAARRVDEVERVLRRLRVGVEGAFDGARR